MREIIMDNHLFEMEYEELVDLLQNHKITPVEFVEANSDLYPDWKMWLKNNHLAKTNGAATIYMEWIEKQVEEALLKGLPD